MKRLLRLSPTRAVLGALLLAATCAAQPAAPADAATWRGHLADAVAQGMLPPEAALGLLQSQTNAAAPGGDPDPDRAFAEIDVGRRLITLRNPVPAEKFFQAAEARLARLVARTPDTEPKAKALYLAKLSLIRSNYLNLARQAILDIDAAILLQPENRNYQRARVLLANSNAPIKLPPKPEGGP